MRGTKETAPIFRVEKGEASEEELAALTAVLLARVAHRPVPASRPRRTAAHWYRRWYGFRGAGSWQC
uniref:Acyl-CoA carboxylase subunit epsilon n=1 Tax=Streptomyces sp. NBC_00003 TaxID=2903608 RepID=A0AAU2UYQ7_9ACTN